MSGAEGTATVDNLLAAGVGFELIDGVLTPKTADEAAAFPAAKLAAALAGYVERTGAGYVFVPPVWVRASSQTYRAVTVAVVLEADAGDTLPDGDVLGVPAALTADVLLASQTSQELARRRADLFAAGTREVWEVDPATRTANQFFSDGRVVAVHANGVLESPDLLPGFTVSLGRLFPPRGGRPKETRP